MKNKFSLQEALIFFLGLAGFFALAFWMANNRLTEFDLSVQAGVFSVRGAWLTAFMIPFTYSGNWQAVVSLCLILLLYKRTRASYGAPLTISALTAVLFYQSLKHVFGRLRPDASVQLLEQHGYGFPSGHTLTSFLVWGVLALLFIYYARSEGAALPMYKKSEEPVVFIKTKPILYFLCILFFVYIVLMGFSRIYVGVHWPSDVLASWFLGMSLLVVVKKIIWG